MAKDFTVLSTRASTPAGLVARSLLAALLATTALVWAGGAFAATADAAAGTAAEDGAAHRGDDTTTVGEVKVTARYVEEDIQEVPVAVTALVATDLEQRNIVSVSDIQFHSPGLIQRSNTGGLVGGFIIRGIVGVSTYFADVPTQLSPGAALYDVQSVQVLNGPQGTLFGRSSTSGAVLFSPTRPDLNEFGGSAEVTGGNYDTLRTTAILNIPIGGEMGIRLAVNTNYREGYTREIGTDRRFNGTENYGGRLSMLWKPGDGKVRNFAVLDYLKIDQTPPSNGLTIFDPNFSSGGVPLFQLPSSISDPNGPFGLGGAFWGPTFFGTQCAAAVANGLQPSVNDCINRRLGALAQIRTIAPAELARQRAGGSIDEVVASNLGIDNISKLDRILFSNRTDLDLGSIGFTTLEFHNIFGFQAQRGLQTLQNDGVGGRIFGGVILSSSGAANNDQTPCIQQTAHPNGIATVAICNGGMPWTQNYTEEARLAGVAFGDKLQWHIGGFYSFSPLVRNPEGVWAGLRFLGGLLTNPFEGYDAASFADGGHTQQKAVYTQGILNLSALAPFLEGLHLTGGYRYSWDETNSCSIGGQVTPLGQFVHSTANPARTCTFTESKGSATNLTLDVQVNHNWMLYAATRTAYEPGGINVQLPLDDERRIIQPTNVRDYELGSKLDFDLGDARFRLNAALYRTEYTNIRTTSAITINGLFSVFTSNAAAAIIQGAEFQGEMAFGNLNISGNYSYTDAHYTSWFARDPLSRQTTPGSSYCATPPSVPPSTGNPGTCLLNLSDSEYQNAPRNQGSLTIQYTIPLQHNDERIILTATGFAQSKMWFSSTATRLIQIYGPTLGADNVALAVSQPGYHHINLRADWRNIGGSRFSVAGWVDNVDNQRYAGVGQVLLDFLGTGVKYWAPPRMYGVTVRYEFGGTR